MSHVIPLSAINQFLPSYKWDLDETLDPNTDLPVGHHKVAELEETARDIVLAKLSPYYVTAGWLGTPPEPNQPAVTPGLIESVTAMLVAGWAYDRQFAEEAVDGESYGSRRVREAYALLEGIIVGDYALVGLEPIYDEAAHAPTTLETDPVFVMGERF